MFGTLYVDLIEQLRKTEQCAEVSRRIYAGATFLSIRPRDGWDHKKIDQLIKEHAARLVNNTDLFYECTFVRSSRGRLVFRFRFRVPDTKSFCCGNQCPNCILLRPKK